MSEKIFKIEMLPAKQGDALWVEYSNGDRVRRILIDGGPINAYPELENKLIELPDGDQRVELVVITHVDTDHIEGIIRLFMEKPERWPLFPRDIWFNGWRHLQESQLLGGREGDFLSALISRRAPDVWNKAFGKDPVIVVPDRMPPTITLADGMKITILSPDPEKLKKMAQKWEKDVDKFGLDPGDLDKAWEQLLEKARFRPEEGLLGGPGEIDDRLVKQLSTDQSAANGSSIAFLAEFEGKSCLFLGDAHADIVARSIQKLIPAGKKRLKVDAVKLSHHGSRANITKKLMNLIDAEHYLVSTNGDKFEHPDAPAIETVIQGSLRKPVIWFNYRTPHTEPWEVPSGEYTGRYSAIYPELNEGGIIVDLFGV